MSSSKGISPIKELEPIEEVAKVLPELQANIRRFLAMRRYEVMKAERAEKLKKAELKLRKDQQRERMLSLSVPRVIVTPTPPKASKPKPSTSNSSPAMQNRSEKPPKQKRALDTQKMASAQIETKPNPKKDARDEVVPVQTWDQNITSLMKNINDITLALNMHDTNIMAQTVKKGRHQGGGGGCPSPKDGFGYFNFSPDSVPFPDLRLSKGTDAKPAAPADTSPQLIYSERVKGVLSEIESEYVNLERTNAQIKQALAKSNLTISDGIIVNNNIPNSTQHSQQSSTKNSTHNSAHNSTNNSPSKIGALTAANLSTGGMMGTETNTATDTRSEHSTTHSATDTVQSSLVTDDSGMYVPIRRSGDARLDLMVQETLIRASNSIMDTGTSTIEEHKTYYHGDELGEVMHTVAIQLNNAYKAIEDSTAEVGTAGRGEEEGEKAEAEGRNRTASSTSVDSVGLDALTRSITAIQQAGRGTSTNSGSTEQTPLPSTEASQNTSVNPSADNSLDSNASVNTQTTTQSNVSELTLAIQDILANLSGGLFERAKLELNGAERQEYKSEFFAPSQHVYYSGAQKQQQQLSQQYQDQQHQQSSNLSFRKSDTYEGSIDDLIMNKVKDEMGSHQSHQSQQYGSRSPLPQLEMAEYLNSVTGTGYPVPAASSSSSNNSQHNPAGQQASAAHTYGGSNHSHSSPTQPQISPARSASHAGQEQQQQLEMEELQVLLQHQERSMQLIRESIKAIEAGKIDAASGAHALHAAYNNLGSPFSAAANESIQSIMTSPTFATAQQTATGAHHYGQNVSPTFLLRQQKQEDDGVAAAIALQFQSFPSDPLPKKEKEKGGAKAKRKKSKSKSAASSSNSHSNSNSHMSAEELELELLRNFGSYLKQQKEVVKGTERLSYDQLLRKAQADFGLHGDEGGGSGEASALQRARVHEMVFRQHQERQQQRYEEEVARKQQIIKEKQKKLRDGTSDLELGNKDGKGRTLYPIYDAGTDGSEAEAEGAYEGEEDDEEVKAAIGEYKSISAAYTYSASQKDLHARRKALEEEIERYNQSHKVPLQEVQRKYEASAATAHKSSNSSNFGDGGGGGGGGGGSPKELSPQTRKLLYPSKEPFNMRDALLHSPVLSSSEKAKKTARQGGDKYSTPVQVKESHNSTDSPQGWDSRFGVKTSPKKDVEGFSIKKTALRESAAQDLYQTQRRVRQQEKEEEIREYRSNYRTAGDTHDEDEDDAPSNYENTHSGSSARQHHNSTTSGSGSGKKAALGKKAARRSKEGEFDENLLHSIEHLHLRPPKSMKSSAQLERSPRSQVAKLLLHPFK